MPQWWWFLEAEPAYDGLRRDGRFASLRLKVAAHVEEQRRLVERMREDGEVPDRRVDDRTAGHPGITARPVGSA